MSNFKDGKDISPWYEFTGNVKMKSGRVDKKTKQPVMVYVSTWKDNKPAYMAAKSKY